MLRVLFEMLHVPNIAFLMTLVENLLASQQKMFEPLVIDHPAEFVMALGAGQYQAQ
jgi:hypothetical protein